MHHHRPCRDTNRPFCPSLCTTCQCECHYYMLRALLFSLSRVSILHATPRSPLLHISATPLGILLYTTPSPFTITRTLLSFLSSSPSLPLTPNAAGAPEKIFDNHSSSFPHACINVFMDKNIYIKIIIC